MSMSIYERTFWVFIHGCTCLWVGAFLVLKDQVATESNLYALLFLGGAYGMFHLVWASKRRIFWFRLLALASGLYCVYEASDYWGTYTLELFWCVLAVVTTFNFAVLGRYGRYSDILEQAKRNREVRLARRQAKRPQSTSRGETPSESLSIMEPEPVA